MRAAARVERQRFEDLERALDALGSRVADLARSAADDPAGTRLRRYGPEDQVVARLELAGPQRYLASRHAGIDVHGDGSTEAYLGRVRREPLDSGPDGDPVAAVRQALDMP